MKFKILAIMALMLVSASLVKAEPIYKEGSITIGLNATTNVASVAIGKGDSFGYVDRVVAYNDSNAGTGVVSFTLFDVGERGSVISQSGSLTSGVMYTNSPRYIVSNGFVTNIVEYSAKRLLINVTQSATNPATTTYKWGFYTH